MNNLHQDIGHLIAHLTRVVNKFKTLDKKGDDFGTGDILGPQEVHSIEAIGKGWCRTANDLVDHFAVTKGAVSQVLAKLEKRDYIIRRRNPEFGKEKLMELTPKGQKAFDGHEAFHREMDADVTDQLTRMGVKGVDEMDKLLSLLEQHIDKYLNR